MACLITVYTCRGLAEAAPQVEVAIMAKARVCLVIFFCLALTLYMQ